MQSPTVSAAVKPNPESLHSKSVGTSETGTKFSGIKAINWSRISAPVVVLGCEEGERLVEGEGRGDEHAAGCHGPARQLQPLQPGRPGLHRPS